MMKRVLPSPVLSLALAALWLVLMRSQAPGDWLVAILLGVAVPLVTRSLRPTPVRLRRPWVAFELFMLVGADVLVSNIRVLRATLARGERLPRGGYIVVPLELRDPNGLAVLSAIMCATPGTVWCELALDRGSLLLHLFDPGEPAAEIALIKARYERRLMEIFE